MRVELRGKYYFSRIYNGVGISKFFLKYFSANNFNMIKF